MNWYSDAMKKTPEKAVERAWARLMRAQQTALARVEAALAEAGLPPLSWYDALLELDRAGHEGLRPFELERHLLLPQYGLSRLLDRIGRAGYLERRPCKEDGRGRIVVITKAGRDLRRRMWPVYAAAIDEAVGVHLTRAEARMLGELLGRISGTTES